MPAGSTYTPIATTTLGSAASDITFSSISGTYTDLILVFNGTASGAANLKVQVNSDTGTNYSYTAIYGTGSAAGSNRESNINSARAGYITTAQTGTILHFQNYSNTTSYKTILMKDFPSGGDVEAAVSLWRSTSAISSIKFFPSSGTLSTGSMATLYGIASA